MPGRRRTGSRPARTSISAALYDWAITRNYSPRAGRADSSKPGARSRVLESVMSPKLEPDRGSRGGVAALLVCLPGLALAALVALACTWAAASGGRALFSMSTSPVSPVLVAIVVGALLGTYLQWP